MVATFAAYTIYAIAGDEIRAHRSTKQNSGNKPTIAVRPKEKNTTIEPPLKPASKPKANPRKTKSIKTEKPADPIAITSDAILAYLSANGSATITKLAKELQTDKTTVMLAAEKLFNEKLASSVKRGGHPAIALDAS